VPAVAPIIYATRSGGTTIDQDARGGNPVEQGHARALLDRRAVPVERIAQACWATGFNLMFFAACRTRVDAA